MKKTCFYHKLYATYADIQFKHQSVHQSKHAGVYYIIQKQIKCGPHG